MVVGLGQLGIELNRFLEGLNGLFRQAETALGEPQVVECLGVVRVQLNGPLEVFRCRFRGTRTTPRLL